MAIIAFYSEAKLNFYFDLNYTHVVRILLFDLYLKCKHASIFETQMLYILHDFNVQI